MNIIIAINNSADTLMVRAQFPNDQVTVVHTYEDAIKTLESTKQSQNSTANHLLLTELCLKKNITSLPLHPSGLSLWLAATRLYIPRVIIGVNPHATDWTTTSLSPFTILPDSALSPSHHFNLSTHSSEFSTRLYIFRLTESKKSKGYDWQTIVERVLQDNLVS